MPHLLQVLEHAILNTILLEINAHSVDDSLNHSLVNLANVNVRHLDESKKLQRKQQQRAKLGYLRSI